MMNKNNKFILDGTKIAWHKERIEQWKQGERIAPITIDMALTRGCNYKCTYCYSVLQENERKNITQKVIYDFLDDCAEIGVKGISLVSDGESTISPIYGETIIKGSELGMSMASGTNGFMLDKPVLEQILPHLTYIRINISAGEVKRYAEIMGVSEDCFYRVIKNIKDMVEIKKRDKLSVTIGLQMVLMPKLEDQILPLAQLGKNLRPDYLVIKHCSDDELGSLGVDYSGYKKTYDTLRKAESLSDQDYKVVVKWSKIDANGTRCYQRCYGPPFILQLSGSGLVAPCGMLFGERYKKYHIGNITENRFKDIWKSDKYWAVMNELSSIQFNAQTMCGCLCLQHNVNEYLNSYKKGEIVLEIPEGEPPEHLNFI